MPAWPHDIQLRFVSRAQAEVKDRGALTSSTQAVQLLLVRRTAGGGAPLAYLDRTASMASAPKDTQSLLPR